MDLQLCDLLFKTAVLRLIEEVGTSENMSVSRRGVSLL
jgi:hypothetical protein